jgi:hypothetical protein
MNSHPARTISPLNVISLIVLNRSLRYRLNRLREGFRSIISAKGDAKCKPKFRD